VERNEERSKVPSLRLMTGIEAGASSEVSDWANAVRAAVVIDSGMWKAGFKEEIIAGVSNKTFGFGIVL
jgi:hypothetical protein